MSEHRDDGAAGAEAGAQGDGSAGGNGSGAGAAGAAGAGNARDRFTGESLGEMIRRQRELAQLPMRRLAEMVGISNPYLSQIERGLRAPSERVLTAIADNLQLSADLMAAYAGAEKDGEVLSAIAKDPDLTDAQRRSLAETYRAYVELTRARRRRPGAGGVAGEAGGN
ncbi:anaerobic benzoate catabolism transcriptional regulator [Corynebacterium hansenii]|nr:anaerobic benzoate catabolism transcriptional regulator [Corynebacterium hansenii]